MRLDVMVKILGKDGYNMDDVYLKEMSYEMFHMFFLNYVNDKSLYLDINDYYDYVYDKDKVDQYIQRQIDKNRIVLAIMYQNMIIGEIKIYDIVDHKSCMFGITMANDDFKGKGLGYKAEKLLVDYVYYQLDIPVIYADCILTNYRSQHVLEKVGFVYLYEDNFRKYYKIERL